MDGAPRFDRRLLREIVTALAEVDRVDGWGEGQPQSGGDEEFATFVCRPAGEPQAHLGVKWSG